MSAPVAILLPVRMETRFDPVGQLWRLRVILVPDSPWIDRHDPSVRQVELEALDRAWSEAGGSFAGKAGEAAFERLASAVGGARAAWLARRFPPPSDGGPLAASDGVADGPSAPAIRTLPARLELWASPSSDPASPVRLHAFEPVRARLVLDPEEKPIDDPSAIAFRPTWESAEQAGLAATILLNPGLGPETIEALYVVGLGEEDPSGLFCAHRDSGDLAILAPGEPTNAVAGERAADLGADPLSWLRYAVPGPPSGEAERVSQTLCGAAETLQPLRSPPRGGVTGAPQPARAVLDQDARSNLLVATLWPALWGANLKDLWGVAGGAGDEVARLGLWASRWLHPQGPLPPIRIGDQPYGILPLTSLARWDSAGDPLDVEAVLADRLRSALPLWRGAGELGGNAAGADSAGILDLLARTPVTGRLMKTLHLPLELVGKALGSAMSAGDLDAWWRGLAERPRQLRGGEPARRFVQAGGQSDLELPLVEPLRPQSPEPWMEAEGDTLFARALNWLLRLDGRIDGSLVERLRSGAPASLLVRLILHSALVAASEVVRQGNGLTGPVGASEGRLSQRLGPGVQLWALGSTPVEQAAQLLWKSLEPLAGEDPRILERDLLATLDTASHRIDPWATGLAWRRLREPAYAGGRRVLGAYGWVDGPFRGEPGPSEGGLLLAPSAAQARAAVILRDRALHDPAPAAGATRGRRWDLDLDSAKVRMAERLAVSVRSGAHLAEAVGREVERAFGGRSAIERLRDRYRLHSSHDGRRTCDGLKVLAEDETGLAAALGAAVAPAEAAALAALRDGLDAYGDLLVADAVFDVVSGSAATAAASLEAAAGLDLPPRLDVIRTPVEGRSDSTFLLAALPLQPPAAAATPVRAAEPALADHVESRLPAAAQWQWTVSLGGGAGKTSADVSLADLGLSPADLLLLKPDAVSALVLERVPELAVGKAPRVLDRGSGPELHARLRRIATSLAGAPASPEALGLAPQWQAGVADELWDRWLEVHGLAVADAADLRSASALDDGGQIATVLRKAWRWGIVPASSRGSQLERRREQAALAAKLLDARTAEAKGRLRLGQDEPPGPDRQGLGAGAIAASIAGLVAPGGGFAIFSRIACDALDQGSFGSLSADPQLPPAAGPGSLARNRLDDAWLAIVAAVRPAAARLEAAQLEALVDGGGALRAWSNRPADPWGRGLDPGDPRSGAMLALYGPAGLPGGAATIAVAQLDAWSETVPNADHVAGAAFGFNAPAARAPQAIIAAVTPIDGHELDCQIVLEMLAEARALARARMATPGRLAELAAALPLTLVPSFHSDWAGVELAQWERGA